MEKPLKWRERFGISDLDLAEFLNWSEASSAEILSWCLTNGKITEHEYFEWAMQEYQLPSVTGDFFTAPADFSFWNNAKKLYPWTSTFLPLTQWEDTLIIACPEPPEGIHSTPPAHLSFRYQLVLASPQHLLFLWNQLNHPIEASVGASVDSGAKPQVKNFEFSLEQNLPAQSQPQVPARSKVNTSSNSPSISHSSPLLHSNDAKNEVKNEPIFEVPEGFLMTTKTPNEPPTGISMVVDFGNLSNNMPNNLSINENAKPTAKSATAQPLAGHSLSDSMESVGNPIAHSTANSTANVVDELPDGFILSHETKSVSESPVFKTSPAPSNDGDVVAPKLNNTPSTSEESSGVVDKKEDSGFTITNIDSKPIESARTFNEVGAIGLIHALKHFEGAMVLVTKENQMKPWKWSDFMTHPHNSSFDSVELESASIFKIAYRTLKPFHGPVAFSPANEAFFKAFTSNGKLPLHATVAPIVLHSQCVGMIVGIARKPLAYKAILPSIERLADQMSQAFAKFNSASAA